MYRLPVELVTKILSHACFDDKLTACSLSLTSKWIGEVVRPIRFEAISLHDALQVVAFAAILENMLPHSPKIKHLFVSAIGTNGADQLWVARQREVEKRAIGRNLLTETKGVHKDDEHADDWYERVKRDERRQTQEALDTALHSILRIAASSIETLFLTLIPNQGSAAAFPCVLPNLVDLSVTGVTCNLSLPQPFPALKRLHIDRNLPIGLDLRKSAPALEELRFTSIHEGARRFVDAVVEHAQSMQLKQGDARGFSFPSSLRHVILQQCAAPYDVQCGGAYMSHVTFTGVLHDAVVSVAELGEFQLALLETPGVKLWFEGRISGFGYFYEDARKDWMAVTEGGKGCWVKVRSS